ncbi:MAG: response regulator [Planctomycetota bacterium]|jgi:CheY-like chemotaxis protein
MGCILLVEDDLGFQVSCRRHIEPLGHDLIAVETAEEALEVIATMVPDLAIIDLILPGMDGAELIRQLRAQPVTAKVPIVAFTCMIAKMGLQCDEHDKVWLPADLVLDKSEGTGAVVEAIRSLLAGEA